MDVLLGLQWGDEGKGKIVDVLAPTYDWVARFQGGPNAGHTLHFDGKKHVLHQIPSGIFHSHIVNLIGNGMVLDLVVLQREILKLGIDVSSLQKNLRISRKAQLILPTHRLLDAAYEKAKGDKKIGSTLKGIGPTYQDKIGRLGLRIGDMDSPKFLGKYQNLRDRHLRILEDHSYEYDLTPLEKEFFEAVEFIKQFPFVDSEYEISEAEAQNRKILAEGAQGTLLDIDFGSYPYVTSSNTMVAGACTGLGIAPQHVKEVFGIFKAYCTRVGSGPFPTEDLKDDGERMRVQGNEFGSTTGRPRRCGWLDLPALKYAVMINGVTELLMMKADVLNSFDQIKVCTHYKLEDGTLTDRFPYDMIDSSVEAVYETLKGWGDFSTDIHSFDDLPMALQEYIGYIEQAVGKPITMISYGPDRTETLIRKKIGNVLTL